MTRIAVITSSYPRFPGDGTAPFVKSICENLAKLGHEVEVLAPYDTAVQAFETQTVPVHRFRYIWPAKMHLMGHARSLESDMHLRLSSYFLLPFYLVISFLALMRLTFRQRSQAIYAHWVLPSGLVAAVVAKLRHLPLIISLHGSDIYIARNNPIFAIVARWVFQNSAAVTACSTELQQIAITLGAPESTLLLPWGADPEIFTPERNHPKLRRPYSRDEGRIVVGSLGRFVHKKGFSFLVSAFSQVIKEHPEVQLVLGGDGALKEDLLHQVKALDIESNVIFPGLVPWDEVPAFLSNLDIFVLPSVRDSRGNVDGLPTVLLEAMSCGTAIVASDIGGVGLVIRDQANGILVPPGDTQALANAILYLINNGEKRKELGVAARRNIVTTLNWEMIARQFTDLLERAVWRHKQLSRLGSAYREAMLTELKKIAHKGLVLDVGCYDGYFLSGSNACLRVGVDLNPISGAPGVEFVQADARHLPFKEGTFDYVYALDVIEHVENGRTFAESLKRVIAPNGILLLSTPSLYIRMFPVFLNRWIGRKWGHTYRLGYSADELHELFENGMTIKLTAWNAPAFRLAYLILRALAFVLPRFSTSAIKTLARIDARYSLGQNGFYLLEGTRQLEH